ncbi:MAG: hypothetical protein R2747_09805 [Pyrinomonadaceae bacterium]
MLKIFAVLVVLAAFLATVGGFLYWQNLKQSPQYSLALLVDAARRDDQTAIDQLVDTDAVVDDFLPQITDKAVELYGRGLPPETIKQVARVMTPIMPSVKERAREELPGLIRDKTEKFDRIPFWAIAIGASRYLSISQVGDRAYIKSKIEDRPLELVMKRNGDRWQVVAVKDEVLARRIAERIGQEIIALVRKTGQDQLKNVGREIGIENLQDIFNQAKDILNK